MSGILCAWNSRKATPWQRMLDDLTVLGRDGKGDWHNREVGLSLGRTQFFNTPESTQEAPVVEHEGCVLVWDGRIDDRESLLASRSHVTDAQLIIEAYRRWGVDCLKHLTGEFVFILWDASNDLLFVGCDVLGGRTLSYYWDGETLLLSSRALTLLLHPQVSKELDEIYLAHTICNLWSHPPGITAFADIKRLRPGFVLILKSGQLQERQVTQLPTPERYELPKSPEILYEKFWYLLNQATKDRLRSHRPICTTISGGLDSTTVTVSLLNHLPRVDAFSNVTTIFREFDERKPIQSFLERYPQVKWHDVNCDRAVALTEPWEKLPIPDDPIISCTMPMNIQLIAKMQELGFGLFFGGDLGDELFDGNLDELAYSGCWKQVVQHLQAEKKWYSPLCKEILLPRMPKFIHSLWFEIEKRKSQHIAPWILPSYLQKPSTQIALQQFWENSISQNRTETINWCYHSSGSVGVNQTYKLFQKAHQIESTSSFEDKRLVEFAINLHPSLQNDPIYNKIFLRKANNNKLPDTLAWRHKFNHFSPLLYQGIAQNEQVLDLLEKSSIDSPLDSLIDIKNITNSLKSFRSNYYSYSYNRNNYKMLNISSIYTILQFFIWIKSIHVN
ncbi:asparagine synthase (glutamine-hydrolyzing) [Rivularia sp. PCC 7116]|uniref:asparagine synthase-related protein n=1 Tax=Rivularia sp. PCC 7116 TaxID=373994 RepID=UPI00029EE6C0|nr:asparagine synthase-related protein [Rivularia sp. PCC 7116]AFY56935.1 asparagine synthase (glutamine-hydrolyzing) [Rivularia sp. PCC 7116]